MLLLYIYLVNVPSMEDGKLEEGLLETYEIRVKVLKAMAHPTRLFILDTLGDRGPMCVCEINELIDIDVSTLSKHISLLYNAGLVSRKKQGLNVFYNLKTPCILIPFSCIESKS